MTEELTNSQSSLQNNYIDQMSDLQRTILESQRELHQLRQDAKADKLNIDALSLLIQIRGRGLSDGGTRILNDLVTYSIGMGIQFDQVTSRDSWAQTEDTQVDDRLPEEQRTGRAGGRLIGHIGLSAQLAFGALLAAAMLWYLQ